MEVKRAQKWNVLTHQKGAFKKVLHYFVISVPKAHNIFSKAVQ